MIDLYYWPTPNGHKITMFLEEAGVDYASWLTKRSHLTRSHQGNRPMCFCSSAQSNRLSKRTHG